LNNENKVIIIGAGASGLFCAIQAALRGYEVLVLEHFKTAGTKIVISGGGRCNFTNLYAEPKNFISNNPHFCISALKRFTPQDFLESLSIHSVEWFEKKLGQLFCEKSSREILNFLLLECRDLNVQIKTNVSISELSKSADTFSLNTSSGQFETTKLVIATGGKSLPKSGASDFAYTTAKSFKIKTIETHAGLVPFISRDDETLFTKDLAGLSFMAMVSINKVSFHEAVLITHKGLSGPAILQISSFWNKGEAISINFIPDTLIIQKWKDLLKNNSKKNFKSILSQTLPTRLAERICDIKGWKQSMNSMNENELNTIIAELQEWKMIPNKTEGYRTAEVTRGGIDTNEISSKTFEAKKVPGLYFIGECLDVTGWLGGYNFQWAWASAYACGQNI